MKHEATEKMVHEDESEVLDQPASAQNDMVDSPADVQ